MGGQATNSERLRAAEESARNAPALASSWAMALPRPPPPPAPCPPTGRIMTPAAVAVPTTAADCAELRPEAGANDGGARPGETPPAADALKRCGAPSELKWEPARARRCFCLDSFVSSSVARAGACAIATPLPLASSSSSAEGATESSKGDVPGTVEAETAAAAEKSTAGAAQSSPAAATASAGTRPAALWSEAAAASSCGCSQAGGGGDGLAGDA